MSYAASGKGFRAVRADTAQSQDHDRRILEALQALLAEDKLQAVERRFGSGIFGHGEALLA